MREGTATSAISVESSGELLDLTSTEPVLDLIRNPTTLREVGLPVHETGRLPSLDHGFVGAVRQQPAALPSPASRAAIRTLDLLGATIGLLVLGPLMLVVTLAVRFSSPGGAVFRHSRVGRSGHEFDCLKFRSMYQDSAERLEALLEDPDWRRQWEDDRKLRNDPRVTTVGRILRRWDLDELPQLLNVLGGSMSLVGPRPVPADEAERYAADLGRVLSVKPGMSGLWQVSGRNDLSYPERVALDVEYVERQSVWLNISIIVKTVQMILFARSDSKGDS
jgi:lipopolysaccharide/colanic/teichoic acid biosynthesis glycosyltransferase